MKALLSVAVIAAMLGGVSVQAATTKKATKKATKKMVKKPVTKKPATAQKVIAKKKAVPASPWSFGLLIENEYAGNNFVKDGVRTGSTYFGLRANYKINSETTFRIHQYITQSYENNERTDATVDDIYLQLAKSNLFKIGNTSVNSYVRAYLPTSINSRDVANKYMELRGELSATVAKAGIASLSLHAHGRYYAAETYQELQPETVEINGNKIQMMGGLDGKGKINSDYRLRNYATVSLSFSDKISFMQQLGVQHTFLKAADEKGNAGGQPNLYAFADLGYQITPNFGASISAYSLKPMNTATAALYNADNSLYYINGVVSF